MIEKEEKLSVYLKKSGLKNTPERFEILKVIDCLDNGKESQGHFSIEDIFSKSREMGMCFSLATIYRTLPILINAGILNKPIKSGNMVLYELIGSNHHDHLLCIECGSMIEFFHQDIEIIQEEICKKYRFEETDHSLCIKGICSNCKGNSK